MHTDPNSVELAIIVLPLTIVRLKAVQSTDLSRCGVKRNSTAVCWVDNVLFAHAVLEEFFCSNRGERLFWSSQGRDSVVEARNSVMT